MIPPQPSKSVQGPGLFTEHPCTCSVQPGASEVSGLVFLSPHARIPALLAHRTDAPIHPAFAAMGARNTNLAADPGARPGVLTVEHVLSACAGLSIWNALITLTGPELPILDGSALPFATLLADHPALSAEPILLHEPITVSAGHATITAQPIPPDQPAEYTYHLDYGQASPLRPQSASWRVGDTASYRNDIAPARTFCLLPEAQAMQAAGLFKSFTPADLLVLDENARPIDNTWRFDNEPARHKLLDLIGDLALLGRPLHARVIATRSGHALNHALSEAVLASH